MNWKRTILTFITSAALAALPATAGAQTAPTFRVTDLTQTLYGCVGNAINDAGVVAATPGRRRGLAQRHDHALRQADRRSLRRRDRHQLARSA